jgi:hypothetical protein
LDEALTVLDVEHIDVFGSIDLCDSSEFVPTQLSDLEAGCHHRMFEPADEDFWATMVEGRHAEPVEDD